MRHGLDQALFSALPAAAKPDKARSREARRSEAVPFELPAAAPAGTRERSSWERPAGRAEGRGRPAAFEARGRDDAPGRTRQAERPEPPRRTDPPRRSDPPRGEDVKRREDPPGHVKGVKTERPEGADQGKKAEASGETETGEKPARPEEAEAAAGTPAPAAPPAPVAADAPTPAEVPVEGAAEASVGEVEATGGVPVAAGPGAPAADGSAVPGEGSAQAGEGAANGKPPASTGTAHALDTVTQKGHGAAKGLDEAALKQEAKAEGSAASSEAEFAKLVEGQATGPEAAKAEAPVKSPLAAPEAKIEGTALSSAGLQPAPGAREAGAAAPQASPAQPPGPVVPNVPLGAVPIEIGLKSLAGVNQFEIRLDPVELGRIDVSLEIDESGEVKAHLVVDRVETLHLLQRDAKTLERAFEQAGLKPSEGGVDLSLRDPSADGRQNQGRDRDESRPGHRGGGQDAERADAPPAQPQRMQWRGSAGVDVRI